MLIAAAIGAALLGVAVHAVHASRAIWTIRSAQTGQRLHAGGYDAGDRDDLDPAPDHSGDWPREGL